MKKTFFLGLLVLLFFACREEDPINPIIPEISSKYFPLTIGSYWVYNTYNVTSAENEVELARVDSVYISRDTIIRGNRYLIFEGTLHPSPYPNPGIIEMVRDSSGYFVNSNGRILFTEKNFTDILYSDVYLMGEDTIYTSSYKMERETAPKTVPAGTFNVLNFKGEITLYATSPQMSVNSNTLYAENVGKIVETTVYTSGRIIESRLVRYHIEPIVYEYCSGGECGSSR